MHDDWLALAWVCVGEATGESHMPVVVGVIDNSAYNCRSLVGGGCISSYQPFQISSRGNSRFNLLVHTMVPPLSSAFPFGVIVDESAQRDLSLVQSDTTDTDRNPHKQRKKGLMRTRPIGSSFLAYLVLAQEEAHLRDGQSLRRPTNGAVHEAESWRVLQELKEDRIVEFVSI
jgi:hypothetical protein